jgi:hypothetical protein
MAYIVIRTIKNRQYRYLQRSYRHGKRVRTVSEYLGPVGAVLRAPRRLGRVLGELIEANRTTWPIIDEEAMLRDVKAKDLAHARMIERFQIETGLIIGPRNPVPIEKQIPVEAKTGAAPTVGQLSTGVPAVAAEQGIDLSAETNPAY